MAPSRSPIVVITDASPAGDDAVAIALLLGSRQADVKLIVATSGNVWAEEVSQNVRHLLSGLQRNDIPVCVGTPSDAFDARARLLKAEHQSRPLGYVGAFARERPGPTDAVNCENLLELLKKLDRPDLLILAPASPLTSIIRNHPDISSYVGRALVMGGAIRCEGNASPFAEFNFWFDPDAAECLLASDLPVTLLPLDAIQTLRYSAGFAATLSPTHPVTPYIQRAAHDPHSLMACDEVLAAALLNGDIACKSEKLKLAVDTTPGPGYGAVRVLAGEADRRPVDVIKEIDEKAFWHWAHLTLTQG